METALGIFVICCMSVLSPFSGVNDGELRGCAPSPNCISSQSWKYNFIHRVDPLVYEGERSIAFQKLKAFIDQSENVHIDEIKEEEYIRLTYFTKVLRFPDRVELYFPKDTSSVQIRSHSWIGLWDVFANRIRKEKLQRVLTSKNPPEKDGVFL